MPVNRNKINGHDKQKAALAPPRVTTVADRWSSDIHEIFKLCGCGFLIDFLDGRKFTRETFQRRLIHLPL